MEGVEGRVGWKSGWGGVEEWMWWGGRVDGVGWKSGGAGERVEGVGGSGGGGIGLFHPFSPPSSQDEKSITPVKTINLGTCENVEKVCTYM